MEDQQQQQQLADSLLDVFGALEENEEENVEERNPSTSIEPLDPSLFEQILQQALSGNTQEAQPLEDSSAEDHVILIDDEDIASMIASATHHTTAEEETPYVRDVIEIEDSDSEFEAFKKVPKVSPPKQAAKASSSVATKSLPGQQTKALQERVDYGVWCTSATITATGAVPHMPVRLVPRALLFPNESSASTTLDTTHCVVHTANNTVIGQCDPNTGRFFTHLAQAFQIPNHGFITQLAQLPTSQVGDLVLSLDGPQEHLQQARTLLTNYPNFFMTRALYLKWSSERQQQQQTAALNGGVPLTREQQFIMEQQRRYAQLQALQRVNFTVDRESASHRQRADFLQHLVSSSHLPEAPAPRHIRTALYPHQRQALYWLLAREKDEVSIASSSTSNNNNDPLPCLWRRPTPNLFIHAITDEQSQTPPAPFRGGILADCMGLGKSLSLLCLCIATLEEARASSNGDTARPLIKRIRLHVGNASASTSQQPSPTQSQSHTPVDVISLMSSSSSGSDSENDSGSSSDILEARDVPAPKPTTPGISSTATATATTNNVNAQSKKSHAPHHFPESHPLLRPIAKRNTAATLIVCPLSLLAHWEAQIHLHCIVAVRVCCYYGQAVRQSMNAALLADHDFVITTYHTVANEFRKALSHASSSFAFYQEETPLFALQWYRIALDEAHAIKQAATLQARATTQLFSERRWCLTGTPLQNRLTDLYSLVKFLHLAPFDQFPIWMKHFGKEAQSPQEALKLQTLMKCIALRRTKSQKTKQGKDLVPLPPRNDHIVRVQLSANERQLYDRYFQLGKQTLRQSGGTHHYLHVLEILLRLRQICTHSGMMPAGKLTAAEEEPSLASLLQENAGDFDCLVCQQPLQDPLQPCLSICQHVYCHACVKEHFSETHERRCFGCDRRLKAQQFQVMDEVAQSQTVLSSAPSTKVLTLMADLLQHSDEKSIVFSQWTRMLDLMRTPFQEAGIPYLLFDGRMNRQERDKVLKRFDTDPGIRVLLISLRAGGVGLNLTVASRVYLLDPWWNPSVEHQAIDRVHRLGQKKPVHTFRYVAQNTVEERMLLMQQKKADLANRTLMEQQPAQQKHQRMEDVRALFAEDNIAMNAVAAVKPTGATVIN